MKVTVQLLEAPRRHCERPKGAKQSSRLFRDPDKSGQKRDCFVAIAPRNDKVLLNAELLQMKALLIVDVQNDFCPGGKLAVEQGDEIVPVLNKYIRIFSKHKLPIFASRDWHPRTTVHFKKFGGVWPVHCVEGTKGAQFHPKLKLTGETVIVSKGMDPQEDSYSAFQAKGPKNVSFSKILKQLAVRELYIGGLATDYCVKFSTLDALKRGIKVKLLIDAIRGVNIRPDDSREAIKKMVKAGAIKTKLSRIGG